MAIGGSLSSASCERIAESCEKQEENEEGRCKCKNPRAAEVYKLLSNKREKDRIGVVPPNHTSENGGKCGDVSMPWRPAMRARGTPGCTL